MDAPGHGEDLERYRARGSRMANNRIDIVTDLEVHPPSRNSVEMVGVTVEDSPPRAAMG